MLELEIEMHATLQRTIKAQILGSDEMQSWKKQKGQSVSRTKFYSIVLHKTDLLKCLNTGSIARRDSIQAAAHAFL